MSTDAERISDLEAEVKRLREVVEQIRPPSQSPDYRVGHRPSHWYQSSSGSSVSFSIQYGGNGGFEEDGGGFAGVSEPRNPVPYGGAGGMSVQPHITVSVPDGAFVTKLRQATQEELAKHDVAMVAAVQATPFKRVS